jgi:uncharacterized alkaline shock family protein YloU
MQEEGLALGSIKISESVIAQIACAAVLEIEGVARLAGDFKTKIGKMLGKRDIPGIKVVIEDNEVILEICAVIVYGHNIPEIASKIQEAVKIAVEKMTNLLVRDVNVNIQGIERGKL